MAFHAEDPRAKLTPAPAAKAAPVTAFAGADYARFYSEPPQDNEPLVRTWYARGQNFIVAFSDVKAGAKLARSNHPDEYCVLLPDAATGASLAARGEIVQTPGYSIAFMPPGDSEVVAAQNGRIIRIFSTVAADLAGRCSNAASYAKPHPNVTPLRAWPQPRDGWKIRRYSLEIAGGEGRFGRIFRCTNLMVNMLDPRDGVRDVAKLSPHHHDDFEQGSLVIDGAYIHDIRWPWTPDMRIWREDEHEFMAAPSLTVIPPPSIHTSRSVVPGLNQMIDIFSPPRLDFSEKAGWVINADDYPMPDETA